MEVDISFVNALDVRDVLSSYHISDLSMWILYTLRKSTPRNAEDLVETIVALCRKSVRTGRKLEPVIVHAIRQLARDDRRIDAMLTNEAHPAHDIAAAALGNVDAPTSAAAASVESVLKRMVDAHLSRAGEDVVLGLAAEFVAEFETVVRNEEKVKLTRVEAELLLLSDALIRVTGKWGSNAEEHLEEARERKELLMPLLRAHVAPPAALVEYTEYVKQSAAAFLDSTGLSSELNVEADARVRRALNAASAFDGFTHVVLTQSPSSNTDDLNTYMSLLVRGYSSDSSDAVRSYFAVLGISSGDDMHAAYARVRCAARAIQRHWRKYQVRKHLNTAARVIQTRWRHANTCPTMLLCEKRLLREFCELTA